MLGARKPQAEPPPTQLNLGSLFEVLQECHNDNLVVTVQAPATRCCTSHQDEESRWSDATLDAGHGLKGRLAPSPKRLHDGGESRGLGSTAANETELRIRLRLTRLEPEVARHHRVRNRPFFEFESLPPSHALLSCVFNNLPGRVIFSIELSRLTAALAGCTTVS